MVDFDQVNMLAIRSGLVSVMSQLEVKCQKHLQVIASWPLRLLFIEILEEHHSLISIRMQCTRAVS